MKDKIVIITGANSGIGKETARALAKQGAEVIMACRNAERAQDALDDVRQSAPNAKVKTMSLDLASFESIRSFAEAFQAEYSTLDILVNNAGLVPPTQQFTKEGFEMQFGVNHLGHFLLTSLLLPQLEASSAARVINVASMMHNIGKIDFSSFKGETKYKIMGAYGQSKLANVLFTRELADRYKDANITSYALHPGAVGTNIAGRGFFRRWAYKFMGAFLSPARGAKTSIYLATTPGIEEHSGKYFNEFQNVRPGSKLSQDKNLAKRLWDVSEELIKA